MKGRGELPKAWQQLWGPVEVGDGPAGPYLRRPGEVLVPARDAERAREVLKGWDPEYGEADEGGREDAPVRFRSSADWPVDVPEVLRSLEGAGIRGTPVHVFAGATTITYTGAPRYQGGPGALVQPADEPDDAPRLGAGDGEGVRVVVLDTGLRSDNEWLAAHCPIDGTDPDLEECDEDKDGFLDAQAGHGTFVSGVVLQVAPGASVEVIKVLSSHGVCDEMDLARGLERIPRDAQVINLSLGGYTADDQAPLGMETQMAALRTGGAVVVAAAGNDGLTRPFWPAALPSVIGVGAVDAHGRRPPWSNSGPWVDTSAPGVDIHSSFVRFKTKKQGSADRVVFDRWARWSGTSFAAPLFAGAIAVALGRAGCAPEEAVQSVLDECCAQGSEPPQLDLEALMAIKDVPLPRGIAGG